MSGTIAERKKLQVTTPELLRERFQLDVRTRSSVESIDRVAKTVQIVFNREIAGIRRGASLDHASCDMLTVTAPHFRRDAS